MDAKRKSHRLSLGFTAIFVVTVIAAVAACGLRSGIPSIDTAAADQLRAAADQLGEHHGSVDKAFWPTVIQKLSPKSVKVSKDGVYVVLRSFFVTEQGLFLLPTNSPFQPSQGSDPSYRQLHERVYRYEIKG